MRNLLPSFNYIRPYTVYITHDKQIDVIRLP